ncbi:MAG: ATP:cob(I)alamin adenosyltransferase, partial [Candidatus Diapherotrites archaeon]|nr:ATP:cob(I)alamin adenosyltransferase [Candidatus Diapherotrites archaeon]
MIYTGSGDSGRTWVGRLRVDKDCEYVELVGDLDEAVSLLGETVALYPETAELLEPVAKTLMDVSSYIGTGGKKLPDVSTGRWEELIDELWAEAGPINRFILRFTDPAAAKVHHARAVLRRAERRYVEAMKKHPWLDRSVLKLLNRL